MIPSKFVSRLGRYVNYSTVYPEFDIGLGVPRAPIRTVSKTNGMRPVQFLTGIDITERLSVFTSKFLDSLERVNGFVLKVASPTSGVKEVKLCPGEGKVISSDRDAGFFGVAALAK